MKINTSDSTKSVINDIIESVIFIWYNDVQLITNETHIVADTSILLNMIPDFGHRVIIDGMNELNIHQTITSTDEFKVYYDSGKIEVHPDLSGNPITIMQYYGRGQWYIPAERVANLDENGEMNGTIEDFLDSLNPYQYMGIWTDGNTYTVNQQVYYEGSTYICTASSTTSSPEDITNWRVLAGGFNTPTEWNNSSIYINRDTVRTDFDTLWVAVKNVPVNVDPRNDDGTYWAKMLSVSDMVAHMHLYDLEDSNFTDSSTTQILARNNGETVLLSESEGRNAIGLDNVENYPTSDNINLDSSTTNASSKAVHDLNESLTTSITNIQDGTTTVGNADKLDGQDASDFAPSGFGLGGSAEIVTGSANDLLATGFYAGRDLDDAPVPNWMYYDVIGFNNDLYCVQRGFTLLTGPAMYIRNKIQGTFTDWEQIYPAVTSARR